jgi:MFS family permease
MAAVLAGFLIMGLALPVLPMHVQHGLGFGRFVVGLVTGVQFAASLLSRLGAGSHADRHGARHGVILGLVAASLAGGLYLGSLALMARPQMSLAVLLLGRALLGAAESFIITGAISWGLGLLEPRHAGKVIAWMGTAMFTALALGGPIGMVLYQHAGFAAIAGITMLLPLGVLLLVLCLPAVAPVAQAGRPSLASVIGAVWLPGCGAALSTLGYGAILGFSSLLFADHGWHPLWLAFSVFGTALIVARLWLGHWPDRRGGGVVALQFIIVQAAGLATMGLASSVMMVSLGAAMAGFGYSLVYPGFGVEAVRRVDPAHRGLAMGLYTAFLDLALGFGTPVLGAVADRAGLGVIFQISALVALLGAGTAFVLMRARRVPVAA